MTKHKLPVHELEKMCGVMTFTETKHLESYANAMNERHQWAYFWYRTGDTYFDYDGGEINETTLRDIVIQHINDCQSHYEYMIDNMDALNKDDQEYILANEQCRDLSTVLEKLRNHLRTGGNGQNKRYDATDPHIPGEEV